eukprot:CAMPEP_0170231312 /NCGR_PEP_ID=MMETSP0116_2-20130129/15389_1 /TAXON_ID=400756 /ORGANISM="Durinskia baltica, Strain CSIRO CS-38" /LENGTH=474 /DNA_ID=CAMNT_0010482081 /DNA_START=43 /DNA_END=1467 /DNA_ORIENTATION=+
MAARALMFTFLLCLQVALVIGQQVGSQRPEEHPDLWLQVDCKAGAVCKWERSAVVLDANWRWVHKDGRNCYMDDNTWDPTLCADPLTCAETCGLDGADYGGTYGVSTNSYRDGVNLRFVTNGPYSKNIGSRLYVMDGEDTYKIFRLKNREFSFQVDVSSLPCGLNGAVYFVEMDRRGDRNGHSNMAGAKYGTGYCDAQCPHDLKFVSGAANVPQWNSTSEPPVGSYGACCPEMDIWEANSLATAFTPHPCTEPGLTRCEGVTCGDTDKGQRFLGICDKDGCDFNPFRLGNHSFYGAGAGFAIDTSRPITVVTQFITADGTDAGDLFEIRRFYIQDGLVVPNSDARILGDGAGNSITDGFCEAQKELFGDFNDFRAKGGMKAMGEALDRGMVLVLSLWDDAAVHMLWLDASYPVDAPPRRPGVLRGPCPGGKSNAPAFLRSAYPTAQVVYSNIKVGAIGSTFDGDGRRLSQAILL